MGVSFFVYTLADQGVIHIRQRHHLDGYGDLIALQAVRIATAIIALVVPATDITGNLNQRLILVKLHFLQYGSSDQRMGLHDFKFFCCQFSLLVQNLFINTDLSDIMKRRRRCDELSVCPGEMILLRFLHQTFQKQICQLVDVGNVKSALPITELHDLT